MASGSFNGFTLHKIGGLSVSAAGKNLIKRQEGFRSGLYDLDGAQGHNCTVGYGHLVHSGPCTGNHPAEQPFLGGISEPQASAFFDQSASDKEL